MPISSTMQLPICQGCDELYLSPEYEVPLQEELQKAYQVWQQEHMTSLVEHLVEAHAISKRAVAGALGVTPSYLSHILAGTNLASATLMRLTEVFVDSGVQLRRVLQGRPFDLNNYRFEVVPCPQNAYVNPASSSPPRSPPNRKAGEEMTRRPVGSGLNTYAPSCWAPSP